MGSTVSYVLRFAMFDYLALKRYFGG
jgi:hypothetical protein